MVQETTEWLVERELHLSASLRSVPFSMLIFTSQIFQLLSSLPLHVAFISSLRDGRRSVTICYGDCLVKTNERRRSKHDEAERAN